MSSAPQIQRPAFVNDSIDRLNNVREINADFNALVSVETKINEWNILSTMGNKKCFERIERNESCLTILAQLPAGRSFKKFGHERGVEIFVLSGIFSDSDGDYSAGCYVRNPAGTYHNHLPVMAVLSSLSLGNFNHWTENG